MNNGILENCQEFTNTRLLAEKYVRSKVEGITF